LPTAIPHDDLLDDGALNGRKDSQCVGFAAIRAIQVPYLHMRQYYAGKLIAIRLHNGEVEVLNVSRVDVPVNPLPALGPSRGAVHPDRST
jgi:hypothetical protein